MALIAEESSVCSRHHENLILMHFLKVNLILLCHLCTGFPRDVPTKMWNTFLVSLYTAIDRYREEYGGKKWKEMKV
jgi:hypothetical protein